MRKNVFGRRFKRDTNQRKALFKSLLSSLVLKERIKTTEAKAKAVKRDADKIITKAKEKGKDAKRLLSSYLFPNAIDKLMEKIAPRFAKRQGGYTRIVRLGKRVSDNAEMVLMEWTENKIENSELKIQNSKEKKDRKMQTKDTKRRQTKKSPKKTELKKEAKKTKSKNKK